MGGKHLRQSTRIVTDTCIPFEPYTITLITNQQLEPTTPAHHSSAVMDGCGSDICMHAGQIISSAATPCSGSRAHASHCCITCCNKMTMRQALLLLTSCVCIPAGHQQKRLLAWHCCHCQQPRCRCCLLCVALFPALWPGLWLLCCCLHRRCWLLHGCC